MTLARRLARLSLVGLAGMVPLGAARAPAPGAMNEARLLGLLAAASSFSVTVEGTKQGRFKGEDPRAKGDGRIAGIAFFYEVKSPRDAGSGMATGKRQHSPVSFTKAVDASSPQFFQAAWTNEVLKSVLFEFRGTSPNGEEQVVYTVKLTNATVAEVRQYAGREPGGMLARGTDQPLTEDVSLAFQKIEVESVTGKTMAADDWMRARE